MTATLSAQQGPLRFLYRHKALASGTLALLMMALCYLLLGIYPFGDATVLTGDLNMQYIPYFSHYQRAFSGEAGFAYGFDKSMGGGLLGLFAYYVSSPLNLLYLLVPVGSFPVVANLLLAVKVALACGFMELYLSKKFPALGLLGLIPALGYGFSAFVFVYAQNIMWHDVLYLMPLLCLGVDRLLSGRGFLFYAGMLALAILANFYIAYMACVFLVLYFVASLVLQPKNERKTTRSLLWFAGGSLLGGGLSAVLLLPTLFNLSGSKGDLFSFSFSLLPQFPLWQLPEKLAFNSFLWPDVIDGLPLVYCGLLLPVLALCFFVSRKVRIAEKLCFGAILLVLVLSFWLTGPDTFWHGLKEPVWFPYRYSWLFCFTLGLLSAAALARGAVGRKVLVISGGVLALVFLLLGGVHLLFPTPAQAGQAQKLLVSALGVAGFTALLWLYDKWGALPKRRVLAALVLVAVCAELCLNAVLITRKFENYSLAGYRAFVSGVGGAMEMAADSHENQRVEKNFYRTLNDPMLLNYRGISHFGSTQDSASTGTLWNLGYRGNGSYLYGSTAFADGVLGIAGLLSDGGRPLPAHWQAAGETDAGTLHENPYALPLLFAVEGQAAQAAAGADETALWQDSFAYQNTLYRFLIGEDTDLLQPAGGVALVAGGRESETLTGTLSPGAEYRLTAQREGYYYALPTGENPLYDLGTILNGERHGTSFAADDQNGVLNLGYLQAGDTVRLGWDNAEPIEMLDIRFAFIEADRLAVLAEGARQNSGTFTIEDGRVAGTIEAAAGREVLFTSIPYDEDWTATVNGQTAQPFAVLGGFLALPLEEGQNEVTLNYHPRGLAAGLAVTGLSALCFAGLLVITLRRKTNPAKTTETGA